MAPETPLVTEVESNVPATETPADTIPKRPSIRKSPSKTMSVPTDLNALKEEINKPKEEETEQEEEKVDLRDTEFTAEAFEVAWQDFLAKGNFQNLDQEVLKNPYQLEGTKVMISIPNEALVSSFEKFRSELLQHLRNSLKNDHISLHSKVVEIAQEKMLYTDREKFEFLKNKYPALKDLQDKLGLDPEF